MLPYCLYVFLILYPGPTLDTYTTVQKGFCPPPSVVKQMADSLAKTTNTNTLGWTIPVQIQTKPKSDT